MKWKVLSKNEASEIMNSWQTPTSSNDLDSIYLELRNKLLDRFNSILQDNELTKDQIKGNEYLIDLLFGVELYTILNNDYSFTVRDATTDGVWRYISTAVIPDIVSYRWGINENRFWKESRRIWLKVLWWYIHLSWQGNKSDTIDILRENTTDEIVQLVERAGANGYRISLYRTIMKEYAEIDSIKKNRSGNLFRRVMKLNTARTKVIEPELVSGGTKEYVKELFSYFE